MEEVLYPTIITIAEDGVYEVDIPDFNLELGAYGETPEDALSMALDVLVSSINETDKLPTPSSILTLQKGLKDNQFIGTVAFNPIFQKSLIKQVYKNRTVTLPTWLDSLGKNKNLNFSRILQDGIKRELGIE